MTQCKFPVWTLLVCAVAASAFFFDLIADALIFDRVAIANGQWWRLFSGNFVHLSAHTLLATCLLAVGSMIQVRRARYLGLVYIASQDLRSALCCIGICPNCGISAASGASSVLQPPTCALPARAKKVLGACCLRSRWA